MLLFLGRLTRYQGRGPGGAAAGGDDGLPGGDCRAAIAKAFDDADNFELKVDDVRISGTRATARVKAGHDEDQVETITLVREGNVWKISQLAGA